MTKMFVGGIPYSTTNQQLSDLFAKYGVVNSATIIMDKYSGQSKGFAFVEMENNDEAQKAIKELDGYALEGRKIGVSEARPKEDNRNGGGYNSNQNRNSYSNNRGGFQRDSRDSSRRGGFRR